MLSPAGEDEPSFFRNEMLHGFREIFSAGDKIALISADDREGEETARRSADRLKEVLGDGLMGADPVFSQMPLPGNDNESGEKLSQVDGAVILVSMGKHNGAMTEHLISLLNKLKCRIYGIVIVDADMKFLKKYLGL